MHYYRFKTNEELEVDRLADVLEWNEVISGENNNWTVATQRDLENLKLVMSKVENGSTMAETVEPIERTH